MRCYVDSDNITNVAILLSLPNWVYCEILLVVT